MNTGHYTFKSGAVVALNKINLIGYDGRFWLNGGDKPFIGFCKYSSEIEDFMNAFKTAVEQDASMETMLKDFVNYVSHGSEEHRKWLQNSVYTYLAGRPLEVL